MTWGSRVFGALTPYELETARRNGYRCRSSSASISRTIPTAGRASSARRRTTGTGDHSRAASVASQPEGTNSDAPKSEADSDSFGAVPRPWRHAAPSSERPLTPRSPKWTPVLDDGVDLWAPVPAPSGRVRVSASAATRRPRTAPESHSVRGRGQMNRACARSESPQGLSHHESRTRSAASSRSSFKPGSTQPSPSKASSRKVRHRPLTNKTRGKLELHVYSTPRPETPRPSPQPPASIPRRIAFQETAAASWTAGKLRERIHAQITFEELEKMLACRDYDEAIAICSKYHLVSERELRDMKRALRRAELKFPGPHRTKDSFAIKLHARLARFAEPRLQKLSASAIDRTRAACEAAKTVLQSKDSDPEQDNLVIEELLACRAHPTFRGHRLPKVISKLNFYLAYMHARQNTLTKAIEFLAEGLTQEPTNQWGLHANVYLMQQQIHSSGLYGQQGQAQLDDDHSTVRTYAIRHRPYAEALAQYLDSYPINGRALKEKAQMMAALRIVKRDRPWVSWWRASNLSLDERTEDDEAVEQEDSWPFCVVLKRINDLVSAQEVVAFRQLLEVHMPEVLAAFAYYCHLSSTALPSGQGFQKMFPHKIHPKNLSRIGFEGLPSALDVFCELWQVQAEDLGVPGRPQPDPNLPMWLLTCRQALRLAREINAIGDGDCSPIDVCRMFTFSSRQVDDEWMTEQRKAIWRHKGEKHPYRKLLQKYRAFEGIDSTAVDQHWGRRLCSAGGAFGAIDARWQQVAAVDVENPMHGNGRIHVFWFVEFLARLSHRMYRTDNDRKPGLAGCFDKFVRVNLRKACTFEHISKHQWDFYSSHMQLIAARHRAPLEKIYRFFSLEWNESIAAVDCQAPDGTEGSLPQWKVRSATLLDEPLNFNGILDLFSKCLLLNADCTAKKLSVIFKGITGDQEVMAQVHKNNTPKVISLDGFLQFMMVTALSSSQEKKLPATDRIEKWLNDEFYPAVTNKLPIHNKLMMQCQGLPSGMDDEALPPERQVLMYKVDGTPVPLVKNPIEVVLDQEIVDRLDEVGPSCHT